jgi:hypothetical protein
MAMCKEHGACMAGLVSDRKGFEEPLCEKKGSVMTMMLAGNLRKSGHSSNCSSCMVMNGVFGCHDESWYQLKRGLQV